MGRTPVTLTYSAALDMSLNMPAYFLLFQISLLDTVSLNNTDTEIDYRVPHKNTPYRKLTFLMNGMI